MSSERFDNLDKWLQACEDLNLLVTEFGKTGFTAHKRDHWNTLAGSWAGDFGYIDIKTDVRR